MFKYLAGFLLFIVTIEFSHARPLYETDDFPPYKCDDQPIQVFISFISFSIFSLRLDEIKKDQSRRLSIWPNGEVIYEIGAEFTGNKNLRIKFCKNNIYSILFSGRKANNIKWNANDSQSNCNK